MTGRKLDVFDAHSSCEVSFATSKEEFDVINRSEKNKFESETFHDVLTLLAPRLDAP